MKTLSTIWKTLESEPRADFLVTPSQQLKRQDLAELIRSFIAGFDQSGLAEGDHLIILVDDEISAITAFLAALLDGLVPVMLTADTPATRVEAIAASVEAKAALVNAARQEESWLAPVTAKFIFDYNHTPRKRLFSKPSIGDVKRQALGLPAGYRAPRLPSNPDQTAYLLFTSGTTSEPTGVIISQRNLLANLKTLARVLEVNSDSRILNDMVLAHADGMIQGPLLALHQGATLIRTGSFNLQQLEAWLDSIHKYRVSHFITVATIWSMIDRYALEDDYFDAPEFTTASSVAATLNTTLWQRLEKRFNISIINQYGLTETVASALYAGSHPEAGAIGTIGKPIDCLARIDILDADQGLGELQLKGDNIFPGYWKNPQRTQETLTEDGWMKTGDLAQQRDDGCYEVLGRKKAVIMSGGFLIRPEEIDEVMQRHPAVSMSVTVGMADPTFEEVAMTIVQADTDLDEQALLKHAQEYLESLKVPKKIISTEHIPLGPAGKPQLNEVRKILDQHLASHTQPLAETDVKTEETVIKVAAEIFRAPEAELTLKTTPDEVLGWDSFAQIAFIVALEERFKKKISAKQAASIRSLADAARAIAS